MTSSKPNKPKRAALSPSTSRVIKKARGDKIYDDPDAVLEDEKSPLYREETDLTAILNHPIALAILSEKPEFQATQSEQLKTDIALFKEDGHNGRYDREWVSQAQAASERRKNGDFEVYERERFVNDWGEESEERSVSGDEIEDGEHVSAQNRQPLNIENGQEHDISIIATHSNPDL